MKFVKKPIVVEAVQMPTEPYWATKKDAWGESRGRYSFRPRQGWSCHHCGGLFRGLRSLLEHQDRVLASQQLKQEG